MDSIKTRIVLTASLDIMTIQAFAPSAQLPSQIVGPAMMLLSVLLAWRGSHFPEIAVPTAILDIIWIMEFASNVGIS
jgi:hypothetical protein